jgi:hypothetical protein
MGLAWIALALVTLRPFSNAPAGHSMTVCVVSSGAALTEPAADVAARTFRRSDLTIIWGCPAAPLAGTARTWLPVVLRDDTPDAVLPGALAVSYPYAGCSRGITIFFDRVRALAGGPGREAALLGYVLAHEIAHVAQGLVRHSDTGVMKARWNRSDMAAIFERRLGFEAPDVDLIRKGLASGACGRAAAVNGRSEPGTAFRRE